MIPQKSKFPSELRYDLINKDWVLVATGRAKRPEDFQKKQVKGVEKPKSCVFCDLFSQAKFNNKNIAVIPNKFPAVMPSVKLNEKKETELYKTLNAVGFHEVVITRHHQRHLAQFSVKEIKEVIDVYQERYLSLLEEKFVNYIFIFHNQGREAGASLSHPHSQIITTPLIDVDLKRALDNSKAFFKKKRTCLYCSMNNWERKDRKRLVFENKNFLVFCPFASKTAFEIAISPKKHLPYFEKANEEEKRDLAEAFGAALAKLYKGLNNPAYNFYLHTAPCDGKKYPFYHWHWTILPKTSILAGFEMGARMEISTIEPEKAAEYLRKQ